jgi:hypothetical protein
MDILCRILGALLISCSKTRATDEKRHELSSGTTYIEYIYDNHASQLYIERLQDETYISLRDAQGILPRLRPNQAPMSPELHLKMPWKRHLH